MRVLLAKSWALWGETYEAGSKCYRGKYGYHFRFQARVQPREQGCSHLSDDVKDCDKRDEHHTHPHHDCLHDTAQCQTPTEFRNRAAGSRLPDTKLTLNHRDLSKVGT